MSDRNEIVVVCTGNICRSPMGEALLAHALAAEESPLNEIKVSSAGVSAYPGDTASINSIKSLSKVGLDISNHRSRRFSGHMLESSIAILVMTEGHRSIIRSMYPDSDTPVLLFRELMNADETQVPDPYGADLRSYDETRDAIAEAIPSIIEYLKNRAAPE